MTQDELAQAADMSVDMISRIEAGATGVRFPSISKLSKALSVDPAELFTSELSTSGIHRAALDDVTAKLAKLSEKDLRWLEGIIDAALKRR